MITASLIFVAGLAWVSALLQNFNHARLRGPAFVMSDRSQPVADDGMSGRMARALSNLLEAGLMYVPATLVAVVYHLDAAPALWAAGGFMAARAGYALSYWLAANKLRSTLWTVGMLCTATMIAEAWIAAAKVG